MAITLDGTVGVTSPDFIPSSSNIPTNGLFLPAANTVGLATGSTERLRIDSSGNLGLGVTPLSSGTTAFEVKGGGDISFQGNGNISGNAYYSGGAYKYATSSTAVRYNMNGASAGGHAWFTAPSGTAGAAISFTQAMTLDASGNLLVGTTSVGAGGFSTIYTATANANPLTVQNGNASTPYGLYVKYSGATPNTNGYSFYQANDSTAIRFLVYSNGGVANYSANNVNLSDARLKTAITPAPSWLAKINSIEVVNFKYKDQTFDEPNLGVIAQQVLSVAPELVDEGGFGEIPEDGVPLMAIYETDLKYAMLKAIQELTARLEALEAK